MLKPGLPSLHNLFPELPPLGPFGASSVLTSSNSWDRTHRLSTYPNITIESANPQLPAGPISDFLPQISSQHLAIPHVAPDDHLSLGLSRGSLMVANAPGAWAPPSHPSSHSVPGLMLPVDNSEDHSQYQRESSIAGPSHSTVVSTSARENIRPVAGHWENNQYYAYPGIAFERSIPPAQPLPETHISPRLSPRMPDKPPLRNLQHQSAHFLATPRSVHVVEAHESLPPDSSVDIARSSRSFLRNAQNFQMGDLNHIDAPNATHVTKTHVTNNTVVNSGSMNGWRILQKHTAPNALHNSSVRFDAPKCDEDTRIEVTDEIMGFIKDRRHPQRLLCMTGAAGSGKSALQQTIAERCAKGNILGAAYFISVADAKRNTASTIVPTIAYQLGLHHPTLQHFVAAEVEHDPLIFSRSLITQMDVLVVRPFENLQRSNECDTSTFPYVILIDGLDECQGDPSTTTDLGRVKMKYKAEDRQAEFLAAIRNSLLNNDLPFRVFIASRPELPIRTALGPTGSLHGLAYQIQLSDQYDATEDMRRYLRRRFQDIGLRIGQPNWFTEGNIETLVQAGSGQFVYVATVFKYVSEPRASPVHMLKTVLNWTPGQATRPFEALDMLYTNILSNAKEAYEAVDAHSGRDFLLLFRICHFGEESLLEYFGFPNRLSTLLNLESNASEILASDLRSLVYLEDELGSMQLTVYHKSFSDFMNEESRAKDLFVSYSRVQAHIAKCCMQCIIESPELHSLPDEWEDMSVSKQRLRTAITEVNRLADAVAIDDEIVDFTHKGGWQKIDMVLSKPSGFGIIFNNHWDYACNWIEDLGGSADNLKKRRPEAAAIMSKSVEKWKHFFNEACSEGIHHFDTDSICSGSDDESSDSD
ncbi:hypothetical protein H1R20_g9298, partial [Candolleomyces eurysporus]